MSHPLTSLPNLLTNCEGQKSQIPTAAADCATKTTSGRRSATRSRGPCGGCENCDRNPRSHVAEPLSPSWGPAFIKIPRILGPPKKRRGARATYCQECSRRPGQRIPRVGPTPTTQRAALPRPTNTKRRSVGAKLRWDGA